MWGWEEGVEDHLQLGEVKDFGFWMFNLKTKFGEEIESYIITTEKISIRGFKWLALGNKQAIINEEK